MSNHHEHHEHYEHHNHHEHHDHTHHNHAHGGGGHEHHHHGNFKQLFFQSLPIALIIMIISPMMGLKLPFQFTFKYSDILAAILSTILLIHGGKPFYEGAKSEFQSKKPGMMALVSMGLTVSYVYSMFAVLFRYTRGAQTMDFFFEFSSLILIMLLGHWIEMKAVMDAGSAQESLAELLPKEAHLLLPDGIEKMVPISELSVGDIVRVPGGENIPADGKIISGVTRVDEALLTGESKPVKRGVDEKVIGGSTNKESAIEVKIQETGDQSFISQVEQLISEAQNQPSNSELLAQKVAGWLFYIALAVAVVTFIVWWMVSDLETAIRYTVTTLVIACPHALGLAIPLVVARSTSLSASRGLLIKKREAIEVAPKSTVMILDKTGTLTTGKFEVTDVELLSEKYSEEEAVALMAGIEKGSTHPIAQSIINYAEQKNISPKPFENIEVLSGKGVQGDFDGKHYQLISASAYGKEISAQAAHTTNSILTVNGEAVARISLGDEIKSTSTELIKELKAQNIQPIMATGDNEQAAEAVAQELDIEYHAGFSPEDKYQLVKKLKEAGETVIMVGDGINDAPSLALADIGIAVGAGTQVAIDSADVVLVNSEPSDIKDFLALAQSTNRKMKENLFWGAGYNFIALPLAAGVLAPVGITLSPAMGAILMSISTVIVAINAMTLKIND